MQERTKPRFEADRPASAPRQRTILRIELGGAEGGDEERPATISKRLASSACCHVRKLSPSIHPRSMVAQANQALAERPMTATLRLRPSLPNFVRDQREGINHGGQRN